MCAVTDLFKRMNDLRGIDLAVVPIHRQPALRKVKPYIDDAGQLAETGFDFSDTSGAADPFNRQRNVRLTGLAAFDEAGEVELFAHGPPHFRMMRLRETKSCSPLRDSSRIRSHCPASSATLP